MIKKIKKKLHNKFFKDFEKKIVIQTNYSDFNDFDNEIIKLVSQYTLTNPERIVSLIEATKYIIKHNIRGSIVECGVWKGGSIMAVLYTLLKFSEEEREIFLFDTYEGMSEPTEFDTSHRGESASEAYENKDKVWEKIQCYSSLEEVKNNIAKVGYNSNKINFIKGKVEETIPSKCLPEEIAILRLDTDWYESTKHELEYLYPKLVKGGVLIIDDYGHWEGCKKAVDEYFNNHDIQIFLNRVDYTCRLGIKN